MIPTSMKICWAVFGSAAFGLTAYAGGNIMHCISAFFIAVTCVNLFYTARL